MLFDSLFHICIELLLRGSLDLTEHNWLFRRWSSHQIHRVEVIQVVLDVLGHAIVQLGRLSADKLSQIGRLLLDHILY